MIFILVYIALGYLFFKYMLPLLRNKNPDNKPREIYNFYEKHPKILVLTMILALFGIGAVIKEIGQIINFIFLYCPHDNSGMIDIQCWIKQNLLLQ